MTCSMKQISFVVAFRPPHVWDPSCLLSWSCHILKQDKAKFSSKVQVINLQFPAVWWRLVFSIQHCVVWPWHLSSIQCVVVGDVIFLQCAFIILWGKTGFYNSLTSNLFSTWLSKSNHNHKPLVLSCSPSFKHFLFYSICGKIERTKRITYYSPILTTTRCLLSQTRKNIRRIREPKRYNIIIALLPYKGGEVRVNAQEWLLNAVWKRVIKSD